VQEELLHPVPQRLLFSAEYSARNTPPARWSKIPAVSSTAKFVDPEVPVEFTWQQVVLQMS